MQAWLLPKSHPLPSRYNWWVREMFSLQTNMYLTVAFPYLETVRRWCVTRKKKTTKKQVEILPRAKNHIRYFFHTSGFIWYFSDMVTSWKTKATKVKLDHQPAPNSIALYPDPQIHIQTDLLKQINNTLWHCNLSRAVLLIEPLSKADLNTGTYSQVYHFYNNDSLAYVA